MRVHELIKQLSMMDQDAHVFVRHDEDGSPVTGVVTASESVDWYWKGDAPHQEYESNDDEEYVYIKGWDM